MTREPPRGPVKRPGKRKRPSRGSLAWLAVTGVLAAAGLVTLLVPPEAPADMRAALPVTAAGGAPQVGHLPFLYQPGRGPKGRITAHLARANPQAAEFERLAAEGAEAREVAALMEAPALDP